MLSFDVEDWFQVENLRSAIYQNSWNYQELRVVKNTYRLLDILDYNGVRATFFVLGWVAEKVPRLIREIQNRGHEIASHGYCHELIYYQSKDEFRKDIQRSKHLLEDCIGRKVIGYRAPAFSITDWAVDILIEEGFKYDSSFFPISFHDRYGKLGFASRGSRIYEIHNGFYEVSISTLEFWKVKIPWGGGGYFRFIPYSIFKRGIRQIVNKRGIYLFYFHPWEIDPAQPRIKNIKLNYRIRHYIGLKKAEAKLKRLVEEFKFETIETSLKKLGFLKSEH